MPPRLPVRVADLRTITREPYVCASCLLKATAKSTRPLFPGRRQQSSSLRQLTAGTSAFHSRKRYVFQTQKIRAVSNGSLVSTAITNGPINGSNAQKGLYQQLSALQEAASSYVDLSRLQLAMRTLESDTPVIRVALLGLGQDGTLAARKLARVLLSDALSEEEDWEKEILDTTTDGRSLLLRYGDTDQLPQSNALVKTLHVPSLFLQRHALEILVTTLNAGPARADIGALEEAVLVPPLTTPNSTEGRVGFVRYPVHKSVIVADDIPGTIELGRLPETLTRGDLVSAALNVPRRSIGAVSPATATHKVVDVDLAQEALDLFRASRANGAEFSEKWQDSQVSAVSKWMSGEPLTSGESELGAPVKNLIASVLERTSTTVTVAEDAERNLAIAKSVPPAKRLSLQSAISQWSADAHRDLQDNLDRTFQASPSWRRTAWWRLFWRIDDVTVSAGDVLRSSWLNEAEQRVAFLSGQIFDSGLATTDELVGPSPKLLSEHAQQRMAVYEAQKTQKETVAELTQMPSLLARVQQESGVDVLYNPPWPQTINLSRQYMLRTLVPELHRQAQTLLVTSLGTIGGSAALGAWFFAATAGHGLYEAGAIVALGLVWSLRRLQKKWGVRRDDFASTVREDARKVLREVETHLRQVVERGGVTRVRPEDERSWEEAGAAVKRCTMALKRLDAAE